MNLKPLVAFTALILCCSSVIAQQNFKPALLITNKGDTLDGFINYKNWKKNPSTITFRKDAYAKDVDYHPSEINGFEVENERYVSADVLIDVRIDDVNRLSDTRELVTKPDSVFLLALVTGPKSLYIYDDSKPHFYIKNNDKFELLEYKLYRGSLQQRLRTETNTKYQEQLIDYLAGCFQVQQDADDVVYKAPSLKKLFTAYYSCTKTSPEYVQAPTRLETQIGVSAGMMRVNLDFTGDYATISMATFEPSTGYSAGGFVDLILPRNQGRWSINNDVLFVKQLSKGVWRSSNSPTMYDQNTYEVGHTSIRVGTMLRYRFLVSPATFYVNAGISNSFKLSQTNGLVKFHKFNANETTTRTTVPHDYGKYELGYLAGVGAKFGKLGAELRMEKSTGMLYYVLVHSKETRYNLLVSYRFK